MTPRADLSQAATERDAIAAKHPGACPSCGHEIIKGESIVRRRVNVGTPIEALDWVHVRCAVLKGLSR